MEIMASLLFITIHLFSIFQGALAYNVVCYFESWWIYRPGWAKFQPSYLNGAECTHIIYAFTELRPSTYQMHEADSQEYASYDALNNLKRNKPGLKTLLAIGGAGHAENAKISAMARDNTLRANFVKSATAYIRLYAFDGLDVDWEFPKTPTEKRAFTLLLRDLRREFEHEAEKSGRERLLLSSAVSAWDQAIDKAYDVPEISKYLDFINVMAYDLHGSWQDKTGHNAPLRNSGDNFNVVYTMNYWLRKGAPREKLNMGIPTYGRGFILANEYNNGFGSPATGPTSAEIYSQWSGIAGYFELCPKLDRGDGLIVYPNRQSAPYYTSGRYWMGYDNAESVAEKAKYIVAQGFGGAMVWALGLDDFSQVCQTSKTPYPLVHAIVSVFNNHYKPKISTSTTLSWRAGTTSLPTTTSKKNPTSTTTFLHLTTKSQLSGEKICQNLFDGKYSDPEECGIFYECKNGIKYKFSCPFGLCYDESKGYCDWPGNIDDKYKAKVPTSTTTTTSKTTTTTTTMKTTTQALKGFSCTNKHIGMYADPSSCRNFIWCLGGRTITIPCPKHLYFNERRKTCDWLGIFKC